MAAAWAHTSLESLRARQSHICTERGWDDYHTPRNLLMSLVAEVGEVTEIFQWKQEAEPGLSGWSDSDRRRVAQELSDVLLASVRLAERCGIDLGDAAAERLERQANKLPGSSAISIQRQYGGAAAAPPAAYAAAPAPAPAAYAPAYPAPAAASPPPAPVSSPPVSDGGKRGGGGIGFRRPAFTRTLSVVTPGMLKGQDPSHVAKSFSPTHFSHGLFSPWSGQKDFEINYGDGAKPPPLPQSLSKQRLLDAQAAQQSPPHNGDAAPQASPPLSPLSPGTIRDNFFPMVEALRGSDFAAAEFDELELFWCLPKDAIEYLPGARHHTRGRFIDLRPGGGSLRVKLSEKNDFVRAVTAAHKRLQQGLAAVDEQPPGAAVPAALQKQPWSPGTGGGAQQGPRGGSQPQPQQGQRQQREGKARKGHPGLSRTLSVVIPKSEWDPGKVAACYSPTHFDHGLFSPHTAEKDFQIEYGTAEAKKALPLSLSKKNLLGQGQPPPPVSVPAHTDPFDLSCLSPKTRELEENFDPVVMELDQLNQTGQLTESDFKDMGITFCIPHRGRTYDLITNGRNVAVTLDRLPEFLALAKERRRQLDRMGSSP